MLDIVLDSASETVDYQLTQLLPRESYFRLQTTIEKSAAQLDATGSEHLRRLHLAGEKMVRDNAGQLERIAELLTA